MDQPDLYEADIHAWSRRQAEILRGLAKPEHRLPNDLDLEHVAEEIEEVGNEQRHSTESHLLQALLRLIKIAALPGDEAVRHWTKETVAFLDNAANRYRPSMRQAIDVDVLWSRARRRTRLEFEIDGQPAPGLPQDCPFTLDELTDGQADPRALAARLAARIAGEAGA